jgi:3-deoxy-D-manno-octulosonic-acid transferase
VLRLYLGLAGAALPVWKALLNRRVARGKEDPARLGERLGSAFAARPSGQSGPVLWLHALSVGESLALLPLVDRALADRPDIFIVLTTSTRTSAEALSRIGLPDRCIHQMLPVDAPGPIDRFLDHWRPVVAAVSELDLWPVMLTRTHRRDIPMLLINCRLSDKNLRKRRLATTAYRDLVGLFDEVLLQDTNSLAHFADLGADTGRMRVLGALKAAARPLPADPATLAKLRTAIGDRPVWLAASTHESEDTAIAAAHRDVLAQRPDTLLIAAPRHLSAADETERALSIAGRVARRSRGEVIDDSVSVYLADTMGEMGLWYSLAPVTFVAHSLDLGDPPLRGKNPYEAIALGSVVLHGPCVIDFSETYAELDAAGAAVPVDGPEALAGAVLAETDPARLAARRDAARAIVEAKTDILETTWQAIASRLPDRA